MVRVMPAVQVEVLAEELLLGREVAVAGLQDKEIMVEMAVGIKPQVVEVAIVL